MFRLFGRAPQPASRSPSPESALTRQGPIPPTSAQRKKHFFSHRITINANRAIATGLPSTGGILIKSVNAVDLEHLGSSRFTSTARPDPNNPSDEEDEWCAKLRSLAPRWYRSISDWYDSLGEDVPNVRPRTTAEEQQNIRRVSELVETRKTHSSNQMCERKETRRLGSL